MRIAIYYDEYEGLYIISKDPDVKEFKKKGFKIYEGLDSLIWADNTSKDKARNFYFPEGKSVLIIDSWEEKI